MYILSIYTIQWNVALLHNPCSGGKRISYKVNRTLGQSDYFECKRDWFLFSQFWCLWVYEWSVNFFFVCFRRVYYLQDNICFGTVIKKCVKIFSLSFFPDIHVEKGEKCTDRNNTQKTHKHYCWLSVISAWGLNKLKKQKNKCQKVGGFRFRSFSLL